MYHKKTDRIADSSEAQFLHPDSEIKNGVYSIDQDIQHLRRKEELERGLGKYQRELAELAKNTVSLKYTDVDHALESKWKVFSFVLKGEGTKAEGGWLTECLREVEKERQFYWRDKGGIQRPEPIVKKVKRQKTGKRTTTGWRRSEREFTLSPKFSRGLFLAAEAGFAPLARQMLERLARFSIVVLREETGGMIVICMPVHAKVDAVHIQPSWTGWSSPVSSPDGVSKRMACLKVGGPGHANRLFSYLGRPLLGALAQHEMKLPLDDLTGRCDAIGGVMKAIELKSGKKRPLDVRVRERLETWIIETLKEPEFQPLVPFMETAEKIYVARKFEQLELIKSFSGSAALAEAEAKAGKEKKLRHEAEVVRAKLEKDLASAELARATEIWHRTAAEARLAAVEVANAELCAKRDGLESSLAAADAAYRTLVAEEMARKAAEGQLTKLTDENQELLAEAIAGGTALAEAAAANLVAIGAERAAREAVEGDLAELRADFALREHERIGLVVSHGALAASLIAQVRQEVPHPKTGVRPLLRFAVENILPFLPKDLINFDLAIKHAGTVPLDPALSKFAVYAATDEAKEFLATYDAVLTRPTSLPGRSARASDRVPGNDGAIGHQSAM